MPVDQQVEHNKRCDEHERHEIEDSEALVPERRGRPRGEARPIVGQRLGGLQQGGVRARELRSEMIACPRLHNYLETLELLGKSRGELLSLAHHEWNKKN